LKFCEDLTISFCSIEVTKIGFGLTIKLVTLCDSSHADPIMRLTLPIIQELLKSEIFPKKNLKKENQMPKRL